ncbi:MAG: histidinol phosphate phosphatase [Rhizobiaceae bacterium]|nr:histidinol phosphate phosphatase [Rhizobiaceae bacterium]
MANDLQEMSEKAARIVQDASAVAMRYFRKERLDVDAKADDSPVTIADRETERFIRKALEKSFPGHALIGEEFGTQGDPSKKSWIIDPIDGTRFFISGYPAFGMLLAHLDAGKPLIGLVRMPALSETYLGYHGGPATMNGRPIRTSTVTRLAEAKIFINEAEKTFSDSPDRFARLCTAGHTRRMSYDCYPHAMVAAGRIDAVTDMGLEPYDYLPLVALVEAAGGLMTDWSGAALSLNSDGRVLTAATPQLHQQMLQLLNG